MLSILLAVSSCFNSFWHGLLPTSYFIFYTCNYNYKLDAGYEVYVNSETRETSCGVPSAARALHVPRVSEFAYIPRTQRLACLYPRYKDVCSAGARPRRLLRKVASSVSIFVSERYADSCSGSISNLELARPWI